MKTRIENYVKQLNQLYDGDNWTGETFIGKLNAINEQTAFAQPVPGMHSVAEILWHSIYWRTAILKRIQGDVEFTAKTAKEQNFLPIETLKKKGLKGLLADLKKSNDDLVNQLNSSSDEILDKEYKPGSKIEPEVEGLIQHDYYHLGQIGYVIAALKKTEHLGPSVQ